MLKPTPHVSGLSYDVVEIFFFLATLCSPSTPICRHIKVRMYSQATYRGGMCITGPSAGETTSLSMPCHQCVPSMYMCNLSVQPFVLFGCKKPRSLVQLVDLVVAI